MLSTPSGITDIHLTIQGIVVYKTCIGCGKQFETKTMQKKTCKRNCGRTSQMAHKVRTIKRAEHEVQFIGIDGEGVTRPNGEHIYDMLAVGNEQLVSEDGGHLHWETIFKFLWEQHLKNPDATFVGFYLGYDFNQWFRTFPEERARMLLTKEGIAKRQPRKNSGRYLPFPVRIRGWEDSWEIDQLNMKRIRLRKEGASSWMYINDVGGYFQTSFLVAINPKDWSEPVLTQEEYDIIERGKMDRGVRQTLEEQMAKRAETSQYNCLENEVLARVMTKLNRGLVSLGVRLGTDQWFGPGQAAQQWLSSQWAMNPSIPDDKLRLAVEGRCHEWDVLLGLVKSVDNSKMVNTEEGVEWAGEGILDFAQKTYFGGWFEIFAHGHIAGDVYEYDINSAYPWIMSTLPCLMHGKWKRGGKFDMPSGGGKYRMVEATVEGSDPVCGAMLHRTNKQTILRPRRTHGWFWWHELQMAKRAGIVDTINVRKWLEYEPCDCPGPYSVSMPKLYVMRIEVGKNTPEGKAYKIIYNSAYGKHVQSIGSPKFSNALYASLITSGCRTMILEAIATHPRKTADLVMVATDGVYFRTQHPGLDISPGELGKWDETVKKNMTLFMPGLYWDDKTREALEKGENPKLKSRGIRASDLAQCVGRLDEAFEKFWKVDEETEELQVGRWPTIDIEVQFDMVSCTQALARGKWETAGTLNWGNAAGTKPGIKSIDANPTKKRLVNAMWEDEGVLRSRPYDEAAELVSVPYDRSFGRGDEEEDPTDLGLSPDGPNKMDFAQLLTKAGE
jgi:hypothetical protein